MNILLVDDHELFRSGLRLLLTDFAPNASFYEAGACRDVEGLTAIAFDLVLMDFHMPGVGGLEALARVREWLPDAPVVVVSGDETPSVIRSTIEAGAAGYIPKSSSHPVMVAALRLVLAGGVYLPVTALSTLPDAVEPPSAKSEPRGNDELTERQMQVLKRAIRGLGNKSIARELNLSEATVKVHLSSAFRALGVHNRTEAVYEAARRGIT